MSSTDLAGRLEALVRFLPDFERPDFEFGSWVHPASDDPEIQVLPFYALSETGAALVEAAHEKEWVVSFDWMEWIGTQDAERLRVSADALARASPTELERLLTAVIRQDRFAEGTLGGAFESGLLTRILRRAEQLLRDLS